jgi:hypothetical protein
VIQFYNRGDTIKILVDVWRIPYDFVCSRPLAKVVIGFFESFTADLALHSAVVRRYPAPVPLGARIDVTWKDFEYRLRFTGGD